MIHPLSFIPVERQGRFFWPLVILALAVMAAMNLIGAPLKTETAPAGIISYELAGMVSEAGKILASWDAPAREHAAFVQGLDFLFIPIYAGAIALGCRMASGVLRRKGWALASLGAPLAWLALLAALLDVIENIALVLMLFGAPANPWPQIALWCAVPKFTFVALGILYALFGGVVHLIGSKR
ncbi:MAG: hypothetical protein FJ010_07485 [Chloroflexi bacterium]|nr:hypothetical protein [Chloroflexota bacterium]